MLKVTIPATELFDEVNSRFIKVKAVNLELEHSLVSVSKWEQIYEKPFLGKEEKTTDETLDYIRCMTLSPDDLPLDTYRALPQTSIDQISNYINAKMTATWFSEKPGQKTTQSSEMVTSEVIYYWLVSLNIDFEVQYWHLNRLLTLVRVCNIKNDPKKKMMPRNEAAAQQRLLNEQRKAKFNTRG